MKKEKRLSVTALSVCFAALVLLLSSCDSTDKDPSNSETTPESTPTVETEAESESGTSFYSGMNYSGYKRPTVKTDKQYLPTEPLAEAEEGKIIYTVNSKSAGRVEGWKTQDAGKESNVVEAVAKLGYKFVKWSDGVTTATRSGDTAEGVYTAIFDYDILDMPIISINTYDGEAITSKEEYKCATFSLIGCANKYEINSLPTEIRGRGNNSWSYPKKSYKFKLSEKSNLLGIGEGKEKVWVLIANQCDQSLQRNHVSFEYGRAVGGIAWEPASTSVEVYLNGEYQGVYLLAEDIRVSKNRVNITDDKPDEIDTGYLLELSNYASGDVIYAANRSYMIHSDLSEDSSIKREQRKFISDYVDEAYAALASGSYEEAEKYIDIDSLLATYLVEELVKNLDSQWDSFYLYKDTGTKLYFGPIWDFDLALGNANEGEELYTDIFVGNGRGSGGSMGTWFAVAMMQEWFRQLVQNRWNEIYSSISEMPKYILDEGELGLRSYERNFEKWKIFGTVQNRETEYITRLSTYTEHYEYLAEWLTNRLEWLNGAFNDEGFVSEGKGTLLEMMRAWNGEGDENRRNNYGNKDTEKLTIKYDSMADYVNTNSVEGPDGFDGEGVRNLFDGDKRTKYCIEPSGDIVVTFKLKKAAEVKAYLLRTANDTKDYPDRNPDSWTFYASEDGEEWTEITHVDNGEESMGAENYMWYGFSIDSPGKYKFYKMVFEISGTMQLSEIRLLGKN